MKKVLILSGIEWNTTIQRHHVISNWFRDYNYDVTFIEGIMSSSFSFGKFFKKIKRMLFNRKNKFSQTIKNDKNGITVLNANLINPQGGLFDLYNSFQIQKLLKKIDKTYDIIIVYVPVRTTNKILNNLEYKYLLYDCVRDFENWGGYPKDISLIEKNIMDNSYKILVDSFYLKNKLYKLGYENKTIQILPHLTINELNLYKNNKPKQSIQRMFYFGDVSDHIDVDLMKKLSEHGIEIHIAGIINISLDFNYIYHGYFSKKENLANVICNNADAILIPYKGNMNGVIPAKIMQALATNLPVYISSFYDSKYLSKYLNVYNSYIDLLHLIDSYNLDDFKSELHSRKMFVNKNIVEVQKEAFMHELFK